MASRHLSVRIAVLSVMTVVSLAAPAAAAVIDKGYSINGTIDGTDDRLDRLAFLGAYAGGVTPAADWNQGTVYIGAFSHTMPNPNLFPGGIYPDTVYNHVPFTITIDPVIEPPTGSPDYKYKYTITGPASDGAVIHGEINGVISASGKSDLVATFLSVTPNDMPSLFRNSSYATYQVDPSLPNPFPISQFVLPKSVDLGLYDNSYTSIYATNLGTNVPEPASLLIFLPLSIGLIARARRGCRAGTRDGIAVQDQ